MGSCKHLSATNYLPDYKAKKIIKNRGQHLTEIENLEVIKIEQVRWLYSERFVMFFSERCVTLHVKSLLPINR